MTFAEFAAINRQRCEAPDGFNEPVAGIDIKGWAMAVLGEAGELAGAVFANAHQPRKKTTCNDIADEIADVVSYCDLLAQRLGRPLEDILRSKWNRVSERIGSPLRIDE